MQGNLFLTSLRRVFRQPAFIVVAALLFCAGAGLNAATSFMKLSFKKLPVPLSQPLTDLPKNLGPWKQVSEDTPLEHDMLDALMTDKYVFRDFVDTRLLTKAEIDQFDGKTPIERRMLLGQLQLKKPAAVLNLGLTYYTGLVDTVAHIPDRCYIADGYEPTKYDVASWDALKDRNGDHQVRFIVFEDSNPEHARQTFKRNVAYFFHCNGEYINDSIAVRKRLARLFEQYGYYMKIEVGTFIIPADESAKVMNDFLTYLLPESEKCLPAWDALKSAR